MIGKDILSLISAYIGYWSDRETENRNVPLTPKFPPLCTGPMVNMVTKCTGSLAQLPVVEMSWGKNLRSMVRLLWR